MKDSYIDPGIVRRASTPEARRNRAHARASAHRGPTLETLAVALASEGVHCRTSARQRPPSAGMSGGGKTIMQSTYGSNPVRFAL